MRYLMTNKLFDLKWHMSLVIIVVKILDVTETLTQCDQRFANLWRINEIMSQGQRAEPGIPAQCH